MTPTEVLYRAISVLVTRLGGDVEITMSDLEKAEPAIVHTNQINRNIRITTKHE